jgi:methylated-DNA-[protein]-cysteine S-methyltransferase
MVSVKSVPIQWIATIEKTPIGPVSVAVTSEGLHRVGFGKASTFMDWPYALQSAHPLLDQAICELKAYLLGDLRDFSIPIDWRGLGDFQKRALQLTAAIPYGTVRTYGDMANQLGHPGAARAFGGAMAHNPMPLIVPCHRVVGSDRKLHGFGAPGGVAVKAYLLEMEGVRLVHQRVA